jgi:hypothetical protein
MGEFALEYEDEQGELLFRGFEKDEDGGGMLYVPPKDEWDTCFPHRTGQRRQILDRLLAFVRKKSFFASIEPSLLEPDFFERWPRQHDYLRKRCAPRPLRRIARVPVFTTIDPSMPPPAVARLQFDRPFRVELLKDKGGSIRLRSDRSPDHASRVEAVFVAVVFQNVPATFDDLTVDVVTDGEALDGEIASVRDQWKGWKMFRLQSKDGDTGFIVAMLCGFGEDIEPPDSPSMFATTP